MKADVEYRFITFGQLRHSEIEKNRTIRIDKQSGQYYFMSGGERVYLLIDKGTFYWELRVP
jgi:hypothetical protein